MGRGFVYAYNGIRLAIREERNVRFHLCAAAYAYAASALAGLDAGGFALVSLAVFCVIQAELMNSAGGARGGQAGHHPLVERRRRQGHGRRRRADERRGCALCVGGFLFLQPERLATGCGRA